MDGKLMNKHINIEASLLPVLESVPEQGQDCIFVDTLENILKRLGAYLTYEEGNIFDVWKKAISEHELNLIYLLLLEITKTKTQDEIDKMLITSAERYCGA